MNWIKSPYIKSFFHARYNNVIWTMLFDVDVLGRVKTPTRYVCETHMPPIMANSKYGQDHKDKYLDTSSLDASHGIVVCQSSLDIQF